MIAQLTVLEVALAARVVVVVVVVMIVMEVVATVEASVLMKLLPQPTITTTKLQEIETKRRTMERTVLCI